MEAFNSSLLRLLTIDASLVCPIILERGMRRAWVSTFAICTFSLCRVPPWREWEKKEEDRRAGRRRRRQDQGPRNIRRNEACCFGLEEMKQKRKDKQRKTRGKKQK